MSAIKEISRRQGPIYSHDALRGKENVQKLHFESSRVAPGKSHRSQAEVLPFKRTPTRRANAQHSTTSTAPNKDQFLQNHKLPENCAGETGFVWPHPKWRHDCLWMLFTECVYSACKQTCLASRRARCHGNVTQERERRNDALREGAVGVILRDVKSRHGVWTSNCAKSWASVLVFFLSFFAPERQIMVSGSVLRSSCSRAEVSMVGTKLFHSNARRTSSTQKSIHGVKKTQIEASL